MLKGLHSGLENLNKVLAHALSTLLMLAVGLLVLDVLWGVFSRFALQAQSAWTEELARFLLVWVALLGASLAFRQNQHLGVDVLTNRFDIQVQKAVAVLVDILVLLFAGCILIYGGWAVVLSSYSMEQNMVALPIPKAAMYAVLPLSGLLVFSFIIEQVLATLNQTDLHSKSNQPRSEG